MNKPVIPWLDKLSETDFVTEELPYTGGTYYHLFEERIFKTGDSRIGDLRYYVYDPTKHGFSADATYPVIYSFHGASASLQGITAINWAGVEYFASPEYQEKMGGAYIICPLANEYSEDGVTKLTWMTPSDELDTEARLKDYPSELIEEFRTNLGARTENLLSLLGSNSVYTKYLKALFDETVKTFTSAGKTIVFGTSAGGYCAWRYVITYQVDAALIMAPAYLPSVKELDILQERKTAIWLCQGQNDELIPFHFAVKPILDKLQAMDNVELFLPELIRMPNYGVYSNPAGVEMGQHCINNAVQCDLMYEDGKPMDEGHPMGVTGWIRQITRED